VTDLVNTGECRDKHVSQDFKRKINIRFYKIQDGFF
jgi:hypothetical protein